MPLGALGTTLVVGQLLDKQALKESFGKDKFKLFVPWYIFCLLYTSDAADDCCRV